MSQELLIRNQAQQIYLRALSSTWRNGIQLHDPSLWLLRDPETEEKMLRDADIAHAVSYRRHMIAGSDWTLTPRDSGSARAPMAVAIGTELLSGIRHFTAARMNLARAFFSGARFGRIHGEMRSLAIGDGTIRRWWVPTRIEDLDKRMFRIVPSRNEEGDLSAIWERWHVGRAAWEPEGTDDAVRTIRHVYQDDQSTLGYGRALREALGWWWYAKEHVFQESLQAVERFGQGVLHAQIDGVRDAKTGLPNEEVISAWRNVLEDLRSRHVLVSDKEDSVSHVQLNGDGWQLMNAIRDELRSTIFTLVLGANLTTSANEGGSYALAEIQENSTEALIQFDRETLQETLTDDLLGCVWYQNHANLVELGIANEKPRFTLTQEKRQDPVERVNVAEVASRIGLPLAQDDIYEQIGFRKPEPGEPILEVPEPTMPANPLGGLGFSKGDG